MKAIGLLSGGLDSSLAARVILEQGIDVEALKFTSPFCNCDQGGPCFSASIAEELGISLTTIPKGQEFLDIIVHPRHGYGSGMNPCIDCRIFMPKKAGEYAEKTGAAFVFTGEVLGQRPMSQHRDALRIVEKESGLSGKLLRPLSAGVLPETEAEKAGIVDRKKLLSITGRSRKPQMELADFYGIKGYACPAGGCLLTDQNFASRLKDHLGFFNRLTAEDVTILKHGRHFRIGKLKFVLGRNEKENRMLKNLSRAEYGVFEPADINGPTALHYGEQPDDTTLHLLSMLFASYCAKTDKKVNIIYVNNGVDRRLSAEQSGRDVFEKYAV